MNITLTGATGFLGKRLIERLRRDGHDLHVLGRSPVAGLPFSQWDASAGANPPVESLQRADAVINLAGEPVAQRWNPEVQKRIRTSRVNGTRSLVHALSTQSHRPQVLISGSAIGYYGDRGDEVLAETSRPGQGFLANLSVEWEKEANLAEALGIRVVTVRIGIVLGKEGGALAQMLPPFRAGVGGPLGTGKQWMSWIHLDDIVGLLLLGLNDANVRGPLNGTAPKPVTNQLFTAELAQALHRPAIFKVPRFALKLLFGEMADVMLASQRVIPKAAMDGGYNFQFSELGPALQEITAQ